MLDMPVLTRSSEHERNSLPQEAEATELDFYGGYDWSLNPFPTVGQAIDHLRDELDKLAVMPADWRMEEVATNVFLLSCGILNCIDEYLRGPTLRLPGRLGKTVIGRVANHLIEGASGSHWHRRLQVRRWRERWVPALCDFLSLMVSRRSHDRSPFMASGKNLQMPLRLALPSNLRDQHLGVPSPFRRLDLTQKDVVALGERFISRFPDRSEAILLLGLRTSGSYFAPLLKGFFKSEGYRTVSFLTIEPNKGLGRRESRELERFAKQGYSALILDDPPQTGGTIFAAFGIARRSGFSAEKIKALVPSHPAGRNWHKPLGEDLVISLEPEQWHKRALLDPEIAERRLAEYFSGRNIVDIRLIDSGHIKELNARLKAISADDRGPRLKRIFEVRLKTRQGQVETRYILAKSVGWGWLGYHAFLAGHRLSGFVPPILGLRDGILYMEWIPQSADRDNIDNRAQQIDQAASYVAARVRSLSLQSHSAGMDLQRQNNGFRLLEKALSRAFGQFLTDVLMRSRLGRMLREQPCPFPTLIDGNMLATEWITGSEEPLKTDYEHHGMGKAGVNVADPAYDLADAILNLALTPAEEARLVRRYIEDSGDVEVEQRLFLNKLLAGLWAMNQVQEQLFGGRPNGAAQQGLHRRFMDAWNFLTVQTAHHCGIHCRPRTAPGWRSPVVMLDVDGVIDRRVFGFPATTAAGIQALALLNAHGLSVAVNTARSVAEVKDYCRAYGLAGGVAEHGSCLWDAVGQRERALISSESADQLDQLRRGLRNIPGVFLDDRHQYSIRAFTYRDRPRGLMSSLASSMRSAGVGDGALSPLPRLVVHHLMTNLGLDRLHFHNTMIDSTIVAKEVDKGTGLLALRDWVLGSDAGTIAVGDQTPDLAMFRVATRSFAPANIGCASQARLLGCRIAHHSFQRGLLEIARELTHPDGKRCGRCAEAGAAAPPSCDLFLRLLQAPDRGWAENLLRAIFNPAAFKIFVRN